MTDKIIADNIEDDLDELTIERAIEFLGSFPKDAVIVGEWGYENYSLNVVIRETKEQKKARLAAEKEAKEAAKLEKERQRYLKLKAKFEGEM